MSQASHHSKSRAQSASEFGIPRDTNFNRHVHAGRPKSIDASPLLNQYIQACFGSIDSNEPTDGEDGVDWMESSSRDQIRWAQHHLLKERITLIARTGKPLSESQGWPISNQNIASNRAQERDSGTNQDRKDDHNGPNTGYARFKDQMATIVPISVLEIGQMARARRSAGRVIPKPIVTSNLTIKVERQETARQAPMQPRKQTGSSRIDTYIKPVPSIRLERFVNKDVLPDLNRAAAPASIVACRFRRNSRSLRIDVVRRNVSRARYKKT